METLLTPVEARVLGCLIEKEATTPDSYPLSLNALRLACNQKSNRDPVMSLADDTVQEAVDSLAKKALVSTRGGAGSRVVKYAHRLHDRLTPEFEFSKPQAAVMGVLFLRGPQTRGELRTRCARIFQFSDLHEVEETLRGLQNREDGPYVVNLPVLPGQKEIRVAHLACGEVQIPEQPAAHAAPMSDDTARIATLESRVHSLQQEMEELKERFDGFVKQFD